MHYDVSKSKNTTAIAYKSTGKYLELNMFFYNYLML
jgi:hypothetical protein